MTIVQPKVDVLMSGVCSEPIKKIEFISRISHNSAMSDNLEDGEKFVKKLVKLGHESVLEHASLTFKVICDRGVSHQLVRHRLASYTQASTRYINMADSGISVIKPVDINMGSTGYREWFDHCMECEKLYKEYIGRGIPAQTARSVLPTCLATEIWVTMNFRELRAFFKLRCSSKAQPEMRQIAVPLYIWCKEPWGCVFEDLDEFVDYKYSDGCKVDIIKMEDLV